MIRIMKVVVKPPRDKFMTIVRKNKARKFKNSPVCTAIEYPLHDKDISGAVIELRGRYPESGKVVNIKCKELAYVIDGSGEVGINNKVTKIAQGDVILIKQGERFYWKGNLTMFMPCVPAFDHKQHKEIGNNLKLKDMQG